MCNILQRYWHRRLRKADRTFMIPVLVGKASDGYEEKSPEWQERRMLAIELFMLDRGQEHWSCACSGPDREQLFSDIL